MSCKLSTSHLPGIWVIEALVQSDEVDISLIYELLKKLPQTSENLGRNARELLSFRILERYLFRGEQSNSLSSSIPKIAFDPSESCEDVLKQILCKTPISNLKATGPEMWKWNVGDFIAQKRPSLDNHSLLQLKDAILSGSNSFLASLKELSGLPFGNQPEHGLLENDDEGDDIMHRFEKSDINNHTGQHNDQVSPSSVDKGYLLHTDLPNEILLPVKRARSATTNNAGEKSCNDQIISKIGCENHSDCFKKNDIQCEKDSGADICAGAGLVESREENINCLGGNGQNGPPKDANNDFASSKRIIGQDNVTMSNEKTLDAENAGDKKVFYEHKCSGSHKDRFEPEYCRNVPDPKDVDILSDNDKYHDDITDIETKKNAFLSSQSTSSHTIDSSTQPNVCVKCNKGGEVLVCNTNCCPLVIHESCSSSRLSFGTMGEFYCPFCAYSQAISSYIDAKKRVSLKRKDLANFVRFEARKNPKKLAEHDGLHKSDVPNVVVTTDRINNHHSEKGCLILNSGDNQSLRGANEDHINNHHSEKVFESGQERCSTLKSGDDHLSKGKNVDPLIMAPYPLTIYREGRKNKGKVKKSYGSERNVNTRTKGESVPAKSDLAREIVENLDDGSVETIIVKNQKNACPKIPRSKRRRVEWTYAEEETLKEGIQKFCNPDEQIPWKQILDFGADVFQESRTAADLKDKWKNLCKVFPEYVTLIRK